jgi:hypothetical protein
MHDDLKTKLSVDLSQILDPLEIQSDMEMMREEGEIAGVQIIPEFDENGIFTLYIKLFPRQQKIDIADEVLAECIQVSRKTLCDEDWHIRIGTIQTLAQLGGGEAIALIEEAQRDPEPYVRKAAKQALGRMDIRRVPLDLFSNLRLFLSQKEGGLIWMSRTNQRGQALFTDLPMGERFKLRMPYGGVGESPAAKLDFKRHDELAASDRLEASGLEGFSRPVVFESAEEPLVCTVGVAEDQNTVEFAFESRDESFNDQWVRFDLVQQDIGLIALSGVVLLHPVGGVYEGRYFLRNFSFESSCNPTFGRIDAELLAANDSQMITDSYTATDEKNREFWRRWLEQRKEQPSLQPAFRGVFEILEAQK